MVGLKEGNERKEAINKTKTEHLLKERRKGAQGLIVRPLASS